VLAAGVCFCFVSFLFLWFVFFFFVCFLRTEGSGAAYEVGSSDPGLATEAILVPFSDSNLFFAEYFPVLAFLFALF